MTLKLPGIIMMGSRNRGRRPSTQDWPGVFRKGNKDRRGRREDKKGWKHGVTQRLNMYRNHKGPHTDILIIASTACLGSRGIRRKNLGEIGETFTCGCHPAHQGPDDKPCGWRSGWATECHGQRKDLLHLQGAREQGTGGLWGQVESGWPEESSKEKHRGQTVCDSEWRSHEKAALKGKAQNEQKER